MNDSIDSMATISRMFDEKYERPFSHTTYSQLKLKRRENPELIDKYLKGKRLQCGDFTNVFEVLDIETLHRRVMKVYKMGNIARDANCEAIFEMVRTELKLSPKLNHENVIEIVDVSYGSVQDEEIEDVYLIAEYCVTSVDEVINSRSDKKLPIKRAHKYFVDLINGLQYLHCKGIVHKDIKPGNLLINSDDTLKIADFGVCELLDKFEKKDICRFRYGTASFQAPEIFANNCSEEFTFSGFKSDIWSAAVTLYVMVTGELPFKPSLLGTYVTNDEFKIATELENHHLLTDLFNKLFVKDPENRIDIEGIKRHQWFNYYRPPKFSPVEIDTTNEDKYRSMTVTPSLHQLHRPISSDDNEVTVEANKLESFEKQMRVPIIRSNRFWPKRQPLRQNSVRKRITNAFVRYITPQEMI